MRNTMAIKQAEPRRQPPQFWNTETAFAQLTALIRSGAACLVMPLAQTPRAWPPCRAGRSPARMARDDLFVPEPRVVLSWRNVPRPRSASHGQLLFRDAMDDGNPPVDPRRIVGPRAPYTFKP
jgi:hypothetical protein